MSVPRVHTGTLHLIEVGVDQGTPAGQTVTDDFVFEWRRSTGASPLRVDWYLKSVPPAWAASQTIVINDRRRDSTGQIFQALTSGTTAGTDADLAGGSDTGVSWELYATEARFLQVSSQLQQPWYSTSRMSPITLGHIWASPSDDYSDHDWYVGDNTTLHVMPIIVLSTENGRRDGPAVEEYMPSTDTVVIDTGTQLSDPNQGLYVVDTLYGDDTNGVGVRGNPYHSITTAIAQMSADDTLLVWGTHDFGSEGLDTELPSGTTASLGNRQDNYTRMIGEVDAVLASSDPDGTVQWSGSLNVMLSGFTITNTAGPGVKLINDCGNVWFMANTFEDIADSGIWAEECRFLISYWNIFRRYAQGSGEYTAGIRHDALGTGNHDSLDENDYPSASYGAECLFSYGDQFSDTVMNVASTGDWLDGAHGVRTTAGYSNFLATARSMVRLGLFMNLAGCGFYADDSDGPAENMGLLYLRQCTFARVSHGTNLVGLDGKRAHALVNNRGTSNGFRDLDIWNSLFMGGGVANVLPWDIMTTDAGFDTIGDNNWVWDADGLPSWIPTADADDQWVDHNPVVPGSDDDPYADWFVARPAKRSPLFKRGADPQALTDPFTMGRTHDSSEFHIGCWQHHEPGYGRPLPSGGLYQYATPAFTTAGAEEDVADFQVPTRGHAPSLSDEELIQAQAGIPEKHVPVSPEDLSLTLSGSHWQITDGFTYSGTTKGEYIDFRGYGIELLGDASISGFRIDADVGSADFIIKADAAGDGKAAQLSYGEVRGRGLAAFGVQGTSNTANAQFVNARLQSLLIDVEGNGVMMSDGMDLLWSWVTFYPLDAVTDIKGVSSYRRSYWTCRGNVIESGRGISDEKLRAATSAVGETWDAEDVIGYTKYTQTHKKPATRNTFGHAPYRSLIDLVGSTDFTVADNFLRGPASSFIRCPTGNVGQIVFNTGADPGPLEDGRNRFIDYVGGSPLVRTLGNEGLFTRDVDSDEREISA